MQKSELLRQINKKLAETEIEDVSNIKVQIGLVIKSVMADNYKMFKFGSINSINGSNDNIIKIKVLDSATHITMMLRFILDSKTSQVTIQDNEFLPFIKAIDNQKRMVELSSKFNYNIAVSPVSLFKSCKLEVHTASKQSLYNIYLNYTFNQYVLSDLIDLVEEFLINSVGITIEDLTIEVISSTVCRYKDSDYFVIESATSSQATELIAYDKQLNKRVTDETIIATLQSKLSILSVG